jgi:uncharacterized membrane protein YeaQ/YmgE (transglycosylase-associated protein family)
VAKTTIGFGIGLIALGLAGYFGSHQVSITALIPAFVGLPLLVLGWLALQDKWRKNAMHGAVMVGLLGFIGAVVSLARSLWPLLSNGSVERPPAAIMQALMAIICAAFVALCVKSFIDARRSRADPHPYPPPDGGG